MIDSAFLRTRVARRVLALFLLGALLPTGILAGVTYYQVTRQLTDHAVERLRPLAKLHGQNLQQRLSSAVENARGAVSVVGETSGAVRDSILESLAARTLFGPVVISGPDGVSGYDMTAVRREHLEGGGPLLFVRPTPGEPDVLLGFALDSNDLSAGVLWAELDPGYLWGEEVGYEGSTLVCVIREADVVRCPVAIPDASLESLAATVTSSRSAVFEWKNRESGEDHLAAHSEVFLKPEYREDSWTIIASMQRSSVMAPVSGFRLSFALILILSLAVVFVLSNVQIRRSLAPLRELREGTRRISDRDFQVRVPVTTKDEFGDLATSFNDMAQRLDRQFSTLEAINEIDRAILSSLDTSHIARTVLEEGPRIAGAASVTVGLIQRGEGSARTSTRAQASGDSGLIVEQELPIPPDVLDELARLPGSAWIDEGSSALSRLGVTQGSPQGHLLLPMLVDGEVAGWIGLGYAESSQCDVDERTHARKVADQVAVALSNARLVERLDELSWGAIRALARTIDAKSQWTAGHSERVTRNALVLGRALGLAPESLKLLERGGLLHDIGKIGVPNFVLDKPSRLTEQEFAIVREHPKIGARILEPVAGLADVITIVRHHHERIDGTGYPDGLSGEEVPYLARLMSVSDVWDSLRSKRPYRPALSPEKTEQIMRDGAGTQFDRELLELFLEQVAAGSLGESAELTSHDPAPNDEAEQEEDRDAI